MKKWLYIISVLAIFIASAFSFQKSHDSGINLFFTKNYPGDNWQNHRAGLMWSLSYLGATLPKGNLDRSIDWKDSASFKIDFSTLGFSTEGLSALTFITDSLKKTKEYKKKGKLDLGLFIAMTVGSSWHYYKITGVARTLDDFYKLHVQNAKTFPVTSSTVAKHHRMLNYSATSNSPLKWSFVSFEGSGDVRKGTFKTELYEAYDIMPNGQLRFAIYDKKGNLIPASDKQLDDAGKPSKCMWCHEISILPSFKKNDSVKNYIGQTEFTSDVNALMKKLAAYRKTLQSDIDFSKTQEHTQMELMYISYMGPSEARLKQEWKLNDAEVKKLIKGLKAVPYDEFKFLGDLFDRNAISKLDFIYPGNIREKSNKEPNFFK